MRVKSLLANPMKAFIILLLFFLFGEASHAAAKENPINIETTPNGFLFHADNLKPGDWIPRNIMISNDGGQDLRYIAKMGKSKSTKGLLEELELLVQKEENTLFKGKLKDFTGFEPRELAKGKSETLFFEVTMPSHLGNEFQGSKAEAEIIFLAEGDKIATSETGGNNGGITNLGESTIQPKIVAQLPNTATNYYNFLFIGMGLLCGGILTLYILRKSRYGS